MKLRWLCLFPFFIMPTNTLQAQQGFVFGAGVGMGVLYLKTANSTYKDKTALSIPNLRLGYRFNKRFALIGLQPGSVYKLKSKDRVFEAVHITGQYWIKDRIWVSAGSGITVDGPAFYTWSNKDKEGFYLGLPSVSLGTGYELWRKNNFVLDIQFRFFYGRSRLETNQFRTGNSSGILLGMNWY